MTYRHIVLFKIHDEVNEDAINSVVSKLEKLGTDNPDIIEWKINLSTDTRKGRIIIEEATFTSEESFQDFRNTQEHIDAGNMMKEIADWLVGDYISN